HQHGGALAPRRLCTQTDPGWAARAPRRVAPTPLWSPRDFAHDDTHEARVLELDVDGVTRAVQAGRRPRGRLWLRAPLNRENSRGRCCIASSSVEDAARLRLPDSYPVFDWWLGAVPSFCPAARQDFAAAKHGLVVPLLTRL